jgi:phosphoserine phosphatase
VDQTVAGFAPEHTPPERFKLRWAVELLGQLSIDFAEVVVIGDSPGEAALFERAGLAIAINPKGGVETKADLVLHNDLRPAIAAIDAYQTSRAAARQPTT